MDDPLESSPADHGEGFAHERLRVLPRPVVEEALRSPVTRRAVVTDVGWFPTASGHRRTRPHGADELIVLLCTGGSGWVEYAGARVRLTAGACVLIPPRTPHAYAASDDQPWTIWWCHVRGSDVADFTRAVAQAGTPEVIRLRSLDRTVALFGELLASVERGQTPAHVLASSGAAWHLLAQLAADRVLPASGTPLERAMRHLEERLDATVRVAELAAIVGLSPSHLTTQFRRATGGGVTEYHSSLKLARARQLLDTTTQPIADVAHAVGYDDPLYFSRRFRAAHGMSPSTYRARPKG